MVHVGDFYFFTFTEVKHSGTDNTGYSLPRLIHLENNIFIIAVALFLWLIADILLYKTCK